MLNEYLNLNYINEQKINWFAKTGQWDGGNKIRLASSNGGGENCEAANGVKFVEIHFSSVDAAKMTKTVGVLPRRTPSPFARPGG